ncbi:hypothetical protein Q4395_18155, partial [Acinetobacter baumannii]
VICGPIGCAVDFLCRLLHLKIILLKKPLRTALCNKADVRSNYTSKNSISNKSINKIIYALANMANIDISQPQAAFSQLQLYCEKNNLELPNKDTCGKAFKDAKYYFDNFNSK